MASSRKVILKSPLSLLSHSPKDQIGPRLLSLHKEDGIICTSPQTARERQHLLMLGARDEYINPLKNHLVASTWTRDTNMCL